MHRVELLVKVFEQSVPARTDRAQPSRQLPEGRIMVFAHAPMMRQPLRPEAAPVQRGAGRIATRFAAVRREAMPGFMASDPGGCASPRAGSTHTR